MDAVVEAGNQGNQALEAKMAKLKSEIAVAMARQDLLDCVNVHLAKQAQEDKDVVEVKRDNKMKALNEVEK